MTIYARVDLSGGPLSLDDYTSSLGESVGAAWDEAWATNPTTSLRNMAEMNSATEGLQLVDEVELPDGTQITFDESVRARPVPLAIEDQAQRIKDAGLEGMLQAREGYTQEALDILIAYKREENYRRFISEKAPGWHTPFTFGAALGASVLDPVNVASAFVPVVGEARLLSMLGKAGGIAGRALVRARAGAVEGVVGAAIVEPLVYAGQAAVQADYGMLDSLLNVGFGAVMGAGLQPLAGGVGDFMRARRGLAQPWAWAVVNKTDVSEALRLNMAERMERAFLHANTEADAGQARQNALASAALFDARARSWAYDTGKTVEDFYDRYAPEFRSWQAPFDESPDRFLTGEGQPGVDAGRALYQPEHEDWAYRGSQSEKSPDNDVGFTMWAYGDSERISHYAGDDYAKMWGINLKDAPNISDFYDAISERWERQRESGDLPSELEEKYEDADTFLEYIDPDNIVDTAGLWDDIDAVDWLSEFFKEINVDTIRLWDGAISFNSESKRIVKLGEYSEELPAIQDNGTSGKMLFQTAYHGTPHRFDAFSLDAIGTGEGNQAHGWGLYFAKDREASEKYKNGLGVNITLDGKSFYDGVRGRLESSTGNKFADDTLLAFNGNIDEAIAELQDDVDYGMPEAVDALEVLQGIKADGRLKVEERGQLFEVDIPENDVLLDEQKTLEEQPEKVQSALRALAQEHGLTLESQYPSIETTESGKTFWIKHPGGWEPAGAPRFRSRAKAEQWLKDNPDAFVVIQDGKRIYNELATRLGSDRAASLALNDLGVKGITYDGAQDGRCFVVFDDKAIDILNKFFQPGSSPANARAGGQGRPSVEVRGDELGVPEGADVRAYIAAAKKYHNALKYESEHGRPVVQPQLEKSVRFSGKGWKKNTYGGANSDKWKLFPKLREIIETSTLKSSKDVHKARKDGFVRFHWVENTVELEGTPLRVGLMLAEDADGNLFYNLNADVDARAQKSGSSNLPGRSIPGESEPHLQGASAPVDVTVSPDVDDVNLHILPQDEERLAALNGPRASVDFEADGKAVITFFKSADFSSAPHELYHIFRREMAETALDPAASPRAREQWAKIEEFVGAKPGQVWTREMEEKFARAGERFLLEGKAPSNALLDVFTRLKQWFMEIYADADAAGLEISPAMREVFNTMFSVPVEKADQSFRYAVGDLATREFEREFAHSGNAAFDDAVARGDIETVQSLMTDSEASLRETVAIASGSEPELTAAIVEAAAPELAAADEAIARARLHRDVLREAVHCEMQR